METIGKFLKHLREQKELSTVDVQNQSGGRISQSYVIQVEQGSRTPSVAKLEAFADVYGIDIHTLINLMLDKQNGRKLKTQIVLSSSEIKLINHMRTLTTKTRNELVRIIGKIND